jgi:RNA polymerase sigma-70 factor (ECF subfamily)
LVVRREPSVMLSTSELNAVIDAVLEGRHDAFLKVMRTFGLAIRSYIAGHVFHLDDIDDLAQDVFFVAFRNLREFRRGDDFGAWLRGIARKKMYEYFRKLSRRHKAMARFREEVARVLESDLEQAAADDRAESIEVLLRCISRLPERMRRVVRAGLDGDKPADLAGQLDTTVGAVYRLHYRANRLLRDCMQKELE